MSSVWLSKELVMAIHERQLAEHAGSSGLRDEGMLDSALTRPLQKAFYGGADADIPALAAAYAFGIARNHPFVDGNKRTAYVTCRTFMVLNGWDIVAPLSKRYSVIMELAAGQLNEEAFTDWLRENSRPEQVSEPAPDYG